MTGASPSGTGPVGAPGGTTLRALWNLRALSLFLLGPVLGVALAAAVFGLPVEVLALAAVMFLFSLAVFGILVRGERRRLARPRGVLAGPASGAGAPKA